MVDGWPLVFPSAKYKDCPISKPGGVLPQPEDIKVIDKLLEVCFHVEAGRSLRDMGAQEPATNTFGEDWVALHLAGELTKIVASERDDAANAWIAGGIGHRQPATV